MFSLVYVSTATTPFSLPELHDFLAKSRANNEMLDVTGMLLYKDGSFMQVLEGEESVVRKLYAKIASDPRHRGSFILLQGPIEQREFPDWSMGFRDLKTVDVQKVPGYTHFLHTPLTKEAFSSDPGRCHKLLLTFKEQM